MLAVVVLVIGFGWFRRQETVLKKKVTALTVLVIFSLVVAMAQPYLVTESQSEEVKTLNLMIDESPSSQLIEYDGLDEQEEINVEERTLGDENNYDLSDNLISSLDSGNEYVLVSDMNTHKPTEEVITQLENQNITLNLLKTDIESKNSVKVEGAEQTYSKVENTYQINVDSTEAEYSTPTVTIDGEEASLEQEDKNTWNLQHVFEDTGSYEIEAVVAGEENSSKYFKAVNVEEKPEVLVLGDQNSFTNYIEEYFEITYADSFPEDSENYEAVISNSETQINDELQDFVSQGNGLLHIGETSGNQLLPVDTYDPIEEPETFDSQKVSIVIDSSVSTDGEGLRESQEIALNIIDALPDESEAGLITYKQEAYEITPLNSLDNNREQIEEDITRLESSGPTFHHTGIKGADEMLQGEGDIIMITDGLLSRVNERMGVPEDTIAAANQTNRPITVVDRNTNVNPEFLQEVAHLSDGRYISPEDDSMQFVFETRETERQGQSIWMNNDDHFITEDSEYTAYVDTYDTEAKTGAQTLINADQENYLTVWRYGLGRTAAISDVEEGLSRLMQQEPALPIRTLTWAVGSTEKEITAESAAKPNSAIIRSENPIEDARVVDGKYQKDFTPDNLGFHEFEDVLTAYNYHEDLQTIGYNEDLEEIAEATGGQVYDEESIEDSFEDLTVEETVEHEEAVELSNYLLLASLMMFLTVLWIRKRNRMK